MIGTQSGVVIGATSTSPASSSLPSDGSRRIRTAPVPMPGAAPSPDTSTLTGSLWSAWSAEPATSGAPAGERTIGGVACREVVIGRDWTIQMRPSPSIAHSMSWAVP